MPFEWQLFSFEHFFDVDGTNININVTQASKFQLEYVNNELRRSYFRVFSLFFCTSLQHNWCKCHCFWMQQMQWNWSKPNLPSQENSHDSQSQFYMREFLCTTVFGTYALYFSHTHHRSQHVDNLFFLPNFTKNLNLDLKCQQEI